MRPNLLATSAAAQFVTELNLSDVPPRVRTEAVEAFTDTVGVGIAGGGTKVAHGIQAVLESSGSLISPGYPMMGTDYCTTLTDACMFNGVACHALEFDDTVHPGPLHPSASMVSACLAVGQMAGSTGADVLVAYIAGIETAARFSRAMNPEHYTSGFHGTGTIGALGSAAATARLLGLGAARTEKALGIAASLASGLRGNTGSMTKPLHAGNAARAGAFAALAADAGLTSVVGALDGALGFVLTLGAPGQGYEELVNRDPGRWELNQDEAWGIKAYPVCGEATALIDVVLAARAKIRAGEVSAVTIHTGPRAKRILRYPNPVDLDQARFSAPLIAALALTDGDVSLRTVTDQRLGDHRLRELADRVEHVLEGDGSLGEYGARVELLTTGGDRIMAEAITPRGWGARRLSRQERQAKFVDCTADRLGDTAAGELFDKLGRIVELKSVAELW